MIDSILSVYYKDKVTQEIYKAQSEHRLRLIDFWGIKEGDKVLEIGCGQGDTTVALAVKVGENGFVHGLDIADEDYGSPETIGKARKRILNSDVGKRIKMSFGCDLLNDDIIFDDDEFDVVVLSHCLWYFPDYEILEKILKKVKKYAKRVCIAEWNPLITNTNQLYHLHAAQIQSAVESFIENSDSNIQTMFYPNDIKTAVVSAGFKISDTSSIYSDDVYDAKWEVDMTLSAYPKKINRNENIPDRLKELLLSQIQAMREAKEIKPMASYVLNAVRCDE
ncbi:MAG: methyltransferase domain-containing protein [Oscillospiraceae bacterium]|nr:methyltransferase domain-containing protein [Oscillospiraceae bacterium]MBQ8883451.1 methyltransferase domain-containing protein [Oscillospiraceae bacterium]